MKAKKHMAISINSEEAFDTIQNIHDKGTQQTRNIRKYSQHNKDNMQKIHGDHYIQNLETESSSSKIRHEVRILTLATLIRHSPGRPSQRNWIVKRSEWRPNWRGRSKIICLQITRYFM